MQACQINVYSPMGKARRLTSIAADHEHVGNMVADGELHPSMFWPRIAQIKASHERRLKTDVQKLRSDCEGKAYSDGWVDRWLDAQPDIPA